jgi:fructokinase
MLKVPLPTIFGAGLVALDIIFGARPDTPIRACVGGTCANVLAILSYFGWNSYPVARMNGDPASERVRHDLHLWGVNLDFTACGPTASTPIIIQEILHNKTGNPTHKFSWTCPRCGKWLPGYKAITKEAVRIVGQHISLANVFFMDRLSRAALVLAQKVASSGGIVFFEPSSKSDPKLFTEAIEIAHIVKYAEQRIPASAGGVCQNSPSVILEICTLGSKGLIWRFQKKYKWSTWKESKAVKAPYIADTCGSGDWCTAGVISQICHNGLSGLINTPTRKIAQSLRYGQLLAAWNCGFEGARGGMYSISKEDFHNEISELSHGNLKGHWDELKEVPNEIVTHFSCPSCGLTQ